MSKRKYTAPAQKIEEYSVKYGVTKERMKYILSEGNEPLLTFNELKIKYDCPTLGRLPEWLGYTIDERNAVIHDIATRAVNKKYTSSLDTWTTREDMYMFLQEYLRKRIHKMHSRGEMYVTCINALNAAIVRHNMECIYIPERLERKATRESETTELQDMLPNNKTYDDDKKFILEIKSIKDTDIRNFLIVTGYLIAEIDLLRADYMNLKISLPQNQQEALDKLEVACDKFIRKEALKLEGNKDRIMKPTAKDVIGALQLNVTVKRSGKVKVDRLFNTLKQYRSDLYELGVV